MKSLKDNFEGHLHDQLEEQTDLLGNLVLTQVWGPLRGQYYIQLREQLGDLIEDQLWEVCDAKS
jgi:acyl carrier protein phosphodiesterase